MTWAILICRVIAVGCAWFLVSCIAAMLLGRAFFSKVK